MEDLACQPGAFSPDQRRRYVEVREELACLRLGAVERPDGLELHYPGTPEVLARLGEWIGLERICCPFLGFRLEVTPEGPARLHLTGGPEVRAFLRAALAAEDGAGR